MKLFVSYARKDAAFVERLAQIIDQHQHHLWIDTREISPSKNWSDEIQAGLDNADTMLLVVTPQAMNSKNVADEWQYYHSEGKPIIPLLLADAVFPFQLKRVQYIDFRTDFQNGCDELLGYLRTMDQHDNFTWTNWINLNVLTAGVPCVVSPDRNHHHVFFRGPDNLLRQTSYPGWTTITHDNFRLMSDPAAAIVGNRIYVFAKGQNGQLWFKWLNEAHVWSAWQALGGGLAGTPSVNVRPDGLIDVFIRGTDTRLWQIIVYSPEKQSEWYCIDTEAVLTSDPAAGSYNDSTIYVFARGLDRNTHVIGYDWNTGWGNWLNWGGFIIGKPSAVFRAKNTYDVFVRGNDDRLWQLSRRENRDPALKWEGHNDNFVLTSSPGVGSTAFNHMHIFARGIDGNLWFKYTQ